MNIERLKAEAVRLRSSALEEEGSEFSMTDYIVLTPGYSTAIHCKRICCIAGDIAIKYDESFASALTNTTKLNKYINSDEAHEFAQEWLGLTDAQANWLFLGYFTETTMEKITQEQAASAIDLLIKLGD